MVFVLLQVEQFRSFTLEKAQNISEKYFSDHNLFLALEDVDTERLRITEALVGRKLPLQLIKDCHNKIGYDCLCVCVCVCVCVSLTHRDDQKQSLL